MRSPFLALIKKDLKGYFDQPTGYILIVVFVALISYWFFRTSFLTLEASLRPLFTVEFTIERPSLPWLLALFVPAATMRLLAEEQRDGTIELLLTQPIRGWIVLLAKFVAGLAFVSIAILATLGIPIALMTAGNLDVGAVVAQYVGSIFLAASIVSIGLFTSSLTRNQIVAFILGLTFSVVLMLIGLDVVTSSLPTGAANLLQALSPITHFSTIARGVIDLRDVLYFVALVLTFLSATFLFIRGRSLSHRSPQYRNLQLGVVGLIIFSLLVGWFGSSIGGRLDLTEDKLFTMSSGTSQILSGLDDLLVVELFQSKDPPPDISLVTRDVDDFLDDFAARSGGKVKIIRRYPDEDDESARKAQLTGIQPQQFNVYGQTEVSSRIGWLGLAMTYLDRREVLPFMDSVDGFEYRLAGLAYQMLQEDRKTVAFLAGNGEKSVRAELGQLAVLLNQQYRVMEIQATEDEQLDLDGVDVLIIPGPTKRVPDKVQATVRAYLDRGGKAMILIDPVAIDIQRFAAFPNLYSFARFVEPYGVLVEDNLVFDVQANETLRFQTQVGSVLLPYPYWANVPIVETKVAGQVGAVVMPWTSSLGLTDPEIAGAEIIPLLRTRATAAVDYAYGDVSPSSPRLDLSGVEQFESDIGVAITGPKVAGDSDQESFRLVVMGDSDWLSDNVVSSAPQNLLLGLNLVDWLTQDNALSDIRSKVIATRKLAFTSDLRQNLVQYANILGVPLAFILIGLLRYVRRRSMGMRTYDREK